MLDCLSFVQFYSNLVSLGFNPRSGGSNMVSCSTESGGVSHKTSHSTGKVLMISFTPLALAFPLLVFQHLNLHVRHTCTLLKKKPFILRFVYYIVFLFSCMFANTVFTWKKDFQRFSELESIKIDCTLKLNSNARNIRKYKKSSIHFRNTSFMTSHFFWLGYLILMSQISFCSSWHCQNKSAGHTSKATPTPSKPVASHVTQPGMCLLPLFYIF